MNSTVIKVENLGKKYRIGGIQDTHRQFRDVVIESIVSPFKRLGKIGKASPQGETFWALKDVSFEVKRGEVLGLIGRNGAGKSTLLKVLSRITTPTEGRIEIEGRVGSLLEVGTGFHPELTGRENIYLNGGILGMKREEIRKKFDEIVGFSGITQFIDTPVKRYSSGMKVRLAFAVASHLEPEILLIDEVLAVGDVGFQKKCLGKMRDVTSHGRTVVFVSHSMSSISGLCSQVLYIKDGKKVSIGPVDTGIKQYLADMNVVSSAYSKLEDRLDRSGPSQFSRLMSLETLNNKNLPANRFKMGEDLQIRIQFKLNEFIRNLEIGFCIFSAKGAKLHTFIADWEGLKMEFQRGTHCVICEIKSIKLFPGLYQIAPWLKRQMEKVDDQIPGAIQFEVVGSDMTGFNQYFERYSDCGVFKRSKWRVDEDRGS